MAEAFPRQLGNGVHLFTGQLQLYALPGVPISIQSNSNGTTTNEILCTSTTAGDAQFRTTAFGVTNWSFGTVRATGSFAIANATTLAVPTLTLNPTNSIGIFTTTTARGSGAGYVQISDPTGLKGYFGYGGSNDTLNIVNALNAGMTFYTNNTGPYLQIASTGGVTVGTPASGIALSAFGINANNTISLTSTGAAAVCGIGWNVGLSSTSWNIYTQSTDNLAIGTIGAAILTLDTNGTTRITANSSGNITVTAPGTGVAVTAAAIASNPAFYSSTNLSQGLAMDSTGSNYGFIQNDGSNLWSLATGSLLNALGTPCLQWDANTEVGIPAPSTVGGLGTGITQVGYMDIPQNLQNAAYATVMGDRGKSIDHTAGAAHTYTINDATVNYPVGASISFDNGGSGVVTIALQTTPANLIWCPSGSTGNRSLAQFGVATARKISAGTPGNWHLTGVGLS